ncbi:hypothetical protein LTR94_030512, partial [Friedmanniomyces endolithicus]
VTIANGALASITTTETVDYPLMDAVKAVTLDIAAVTEGLTDAVTEGDKARIEQVGAQANKVRADLDKLGQIPGHAATGARLKNEFDAYYAPALSSARIMLEMEQGDPQATVGKMQAALASLNADLAKTVDSAQRQFAAGIGQDGARRRIALRAGGDGQRQLADRPALALIDELSRFGPVRSADVFEHGMRHRRIPPAARTFVLIAPDV